MLYMSLELAPSRPPNMVATKGKLSQSEKRDCVCWVGGGLEPNLYLFLFHGIEKYTKNRFSSLIKNSPSPGW